MGTSNAVNLTDGLDGLAIVPTIMVASAFAIIAYVSGNVNFSGYLNIPYLPHASELVVVCAALIGAGWWWIALPLAASLPLHLMDLRTRLAAPSDH